MKTLYIDCGMGAAGDMLTAALTELLPDPEAFLHKLNAIGIPGVQTNMASVCKCGITGTQISVSVDGVEENDGIDQAHPHEAHAHEHHHTHEPEHAHTAKHHHSSLLDIEHLIGHLAVSEKVRQDAISIYRIIAEAESHAHGVSVSEIHFHEVGTKDAIADIVAVCMLMEQIAPDEVVASPICVGGGHVQCAHGILPVPAPATAYILHDIPIYGGNIQSELCTPTGAALLKHFVSRFAPMPLLKVKKIGYGMGKKDFSTANCIRVFLGDSSSNNETITELSCNLDDMTPEAIGFATHVFFEAGALDVYTVSVGMKKDRPGILLYVICKNNIKDQMIRLIFRHTTTLGIRENISNRYSLDRRIDIVETAFGTIRKKISYGYDVVREKYEYDDLARIATENDLSIDELLKKIP